MRDDTSTRTMGARDGGGTGLTELGLPLEELVRRGARDILQRAMEAEVQMFLEAFGSVSLIDGRRAVVRSGDRPERAILTTVGPVTVAVPKVRDLSGSPYAYWWVDGIDTTLSETDDPRLCLLVIIGVTADGTKEWVAINDGRRESTAFWLEVLRDLKERGLAVGPRLAVGDGALGFWAALEQVDPDTAHQRCWFHTMGKVLAALPKRLQGKAKAD